jgi:glycosidase
VVFSGGSATPRPAVEWRIGTEADLRALVDTAHATTGVDGNGMKVLFDYVMNHVDIESGLYRAHNDWFARRDGRFPLCGPDGLWDDPYWGTRCAFTDYLPAFDFENADARAWSVNDALWWAREFDLDGYRLDAIKHVPLSWLTDLRSRLNSDITDPAGGRFYLVGETFSYDDRDLIRRFVEPETMLDGQFDFPFKARACEAFFTPGGRLDALSAWMDSNDGYYGASSIMTTWIGNHDIPRPIHFASREIGNCREGSFTGNAWHWGPGQPTDAAAYERLGLVFAVMFTSPGIPLIYYGDEIGLAGGGDPDNRRMMPWVDASLSAPQRALRENVRQLSRARAANKVLARGRRSTLSADQDTWVYRMTGCETEGSTDVIVAINRGDSARTVGVPAGSYTNLLTDASVSGGDVSLAPRSFLVLGAP